MQLQAQTKAQGRELQRTRFQTQHEKQGYCPFTQYIVYNLFFLEKKNEIVEFTV